MQTAPTFEQEQRYWQEGIRLIAGIDEVGVGALAGPVIAAAVIICRGKSQISKHKIQIMGLTGLIRDSKALSAKQREAAATWIKVNALAWAVGEASVAEITELNILRASHLAMRRAVDQLADRPELLVVDGRLAQIHPQIPAISFVDGDENVCSIAAASILAKVHRDGIMTKLDSLFPAYGFAQHKGYGTAAHKAALAEHGTCPHHRPTYAPVAALLDFAS